MKILYLTNHLNGDDGWSRYSLDLIDEVQSHNHQILCLVSRKSNQHQIKEKVVLKPPLRFLANPVLSCLAAHQIKKIVEEFSPEIIHFLVEPYATILPFFRKNTKVFLTVHGTYSFIPNLLNNYFKKKISVWLSKQIFKKVDAIISVSNYTKKYLIKESANLDDKIKVINNGVNLKVFKIIDLTKKPKNEIKKVLFVGAVKKGKGILQAIEALKQYNDRFSDKFIYYIIGNYNPENNYSQKLLEKINEYNFEDKVRFLGKISNEELNKFYKSSDLFLMLSINDGCDFEGFGLVFLEANTKGMPCIGPNNSGCQEAIQDGITGYTVNPYDAKATADKINLILNQKTIQRENCINWAKQNSIKEKYKELIQVYEE